MSEKPITTPRKKLLVLVAPDLRGLEPARLGMKVANGLAAGMDVDVRVADKMLYDVKADEIFIDEAINV